MKTPTTGAGLAGVDIAVTLKRDVPERAAPGTPNGHAACARLIGIARPESSAAAVNAVADAPP